MLGGDQTSDRDPPHPPDHPSASQYEGRLDEVGAICAAFHALEEGVLISDERGAVLAANPAASRILGVPLDQILGGAPADAQALEARFREGPEVTPENSASLRVLRTGVPERGLAVEFRDPSSGDQRMLRASVHPLVHEGESRPWGVVSSFVDMTARERELSELAFRDALTGLPNRRVLEQHLELAIARAQRSDRRLGVLFFDVDSLKTINDSLGHRAGDELLREIAERLSTLIRPSDLLVRQERGEHVLGRLGGDEFLLVLSDLEHDPEQTLEEVARRVRDALGKAFVVAGRSLKVTVSFGMSVYPADGRSAAELLARADATMYAQKRGRPGES